MASNEDLGFQSIEKTIEIVQYLSQEFYILKSQNGSKIIDDTNEI